MYTALISLEGRWEEIVIDDRTQLPHPQHLMRNTFVFEHHPCPIQPSFLFLGIPCDTTLSIACTDQLSHGRKMGVCVCEFPPSAAP